MPPTVVLDQVRVTAVGWGEVTRIQVGGSAAADPARRRTTMACAGALTHAS
jgi:hypothetical protein